VGIDRVETPAGIAGRGRWRAETDRRVVSYRGGVRRAPLGAGGRSRCSRTFPFARWTILTRRSDAHSFMAVVSGLLRLPTNRALCI
jgi:hypothetical protein